MILSLIKESCLTYATYHSANHIELIEDPKKNWH